MKRQSAMLLMVALALVSLIVHFVAGWQAAVHEAATHGEAALWGDYLVEWTRDTFENLQSEFWQLAVQMALLAGLLKWMGVTAFEEDNEEIKARLDAIEQKLP